MIRWYEWLWMIPLALLLSPFGAIVVYVVFGSYLGWILPVIGLIAVGTAGAGEDGYD